MILSKRRITKALTSLCRYAFVVRKPKRQVPIFKCKTHGSFLAILNGTQLDIKVSKILHVLNYQWLSNL